MCGHCSESVNVYQLGADQWICTDHLGQSVALACDVWPTDVSYSAAFETAVLM